MCNGPKRVKSFLFRIVAFCFFGLVLKIINYLDHYQKGGLDNHLTVEIELLGLVIFDTPKSQSNFCVSNQIRNAISNSLAVL